MNYKNIIKTSLFASMALFAASCNRDNVELPSGGGNVDNPTIALMASDGDGYAFEDGYQLTLKNYSPDLGSADWTSSLSVLDSVVYTKEAAAWSANKQMEVTQSATDIFVKAYSTALSGITYDADNSFTIADGTNQNLQDCDLLYSASKYSSEDESYTEGESAAQKNLSIKLDHAMAQIVVDVKVSSVSGSAEINGGDLTASYAKITGLNNVVTPTFVEGAISYEGSGNNDASVYAQVSYLDGDKAEVVPESGYTYVRLVAYVPAQTWAKQMEFNALGYDFTTESGNGSQTMVAGKSYQFNINAGFGSIVMGEAVVVNEFVTVAPTQTEAVPSVAWDGVTIADGFAKGDGTETNPYIIASGAELAYLSAAVNGGIADPAGDGSTYLPVKVFAGNYFKLAANIDLQGNNWIPIGTVNKFQGCFDGAGKTISNISIAADFTTAEGKDKYFVGVAKTIYFGLFGNAASVAAKEESTNEEGVLVPATPKMNGYIKNLTVSYDGVDINSNDLPSVFGGIVGLCSGNATSEADLVNGTYIVENCHVSCNQGSLIKVTETVNTSVVGGIVGNAGNSMTTWAKILGCTTTDLTVESTFQVGGILGVTNVGLVAGCEVVNCNLTTMTGNVGGICAALSKFAVKPTNGDAIIATCKASGVVASKGGDKAKVVIGGIVGLCYGRVVGCSSTVTMGENITPVPFGEVAGVVKGNKGPTYMGAEVACYPSLDIESLDADAYAVMNSTVANFESYMVGDLQAYDPSRTPYSFPAEYSFDSNGKIVNISPAIQ